MCVSNRTASPIASAMTRWACASAAPHGTIRTGRSKPNSRATTPSAPPATPRRYTRKSAAWRKRTAPDAICLRSSYRARIPASPIIRSASPAPAIHIRIDKNYATTYFEDRPKAVSAGLGRGMAGSRPLCEEIPPETSGIRWVHENAASPEHYLPETMGPGCAFLDYDNDGWMDIFLVNSGPCDFYKPQKPIGNALYKNNRDGTFTDVTEKAGVAGNTFGMGVAAGDYNNDGFPDLFVTAYGRPILYRNNGNGAYTDVSEKSGLGARAFENHWTTSAVWFDFDNDGRLDLFVCSFVDYGATSHFSCGDNKLGKHFYCIPRVFKGTSSLLFHNNGDGTFTEVGRGTDIEKAIGKGLGVVAADINNDGRMDLFVANDTVQNFLYVNRGPDAKGKTKWEDVVLAAEVGFSEDGRARSGMGVDAADFDGDGWQDLFVANVDQEMFSLYKNMKDETFLDVAFKNEVAQATRLLSGWGLRFFDYDNDGALDLFLANGHPDDMIDNYSQRVKYKEPLLLFHNENGRLR